MKKLLLFLFSLTALTVSAQTVYAPQGTPKGTNTFAGTLVVDTALVFPVGDTTMGSYYNPAVRKRGMMKYNPTTNSLWAFNGTQWIKVNSSSGGGGGSATKFSNAGSVKFSTVSPDSVRADLSTNLTVTGYKNVPTTDSTLLTKYKADSLYGGYVTEAFTQTIAFNAPNKYSKTTQTGNILFTIAGSGNMDNSSYVSVVKPDHVHSLSVDENKFYVRGVVDTSQVNIFSFYYPAAGIRPIVSITTIPTFDTLATVTGLVAVGGYNEIELSWNPVSRATAYDVYRSAHNANSFSLIASIPATTYTNTGLANNTVYDYRVVSGAYGLVSGAPSAIVSDTSLAPPVLTYPQSVIASNPIYYNKMDVNSSTLTPTVGSANITLSGATPNQSGAYGSSKSVSFNGTTDNGVLPINLGAYNDAAFEFWFYMSESPAPADDGTVLSLADSWTATIGGFAFSNFYSDGAGDRAYLGYTGQSNLSNVTFPKITTVGWHHVVLRLSHFGLQWAIVDGVEQTVSGTGTGGGDNSSFSSQSLYLMSSGLTPGYNSTGRLQDLAIYAGTIPTKAAFILHYNNRNN